MINNIIANSMFKRQIKPAYDSLLKQKVVCEEQLKVINHMINSIEEILDLEVTQDNKATNQ